MRRLAPLTVLPVVVAACGGGNHTLSHLDLVQRANAICQRFDEQLRALPQPTNPLEVGAYIKKAVPLEKIALTKLEKLTPSKSDEADYKQFVAQVQRETTLAQNELVPATQEPSNPKHVRFILNKLEAMDRQGNAIARKLGLSACGKSASASG